MGARYRGTAARWRRSAACSQRTSAVAPRMVGSVSISPPFFWPRSMGLITSIEALDSAARHLGRDRTCAQVPASGRTVPGVPRELVWARLALSSRGNRRIRNETSQAVANWVSAPDRVAFDRQPFQGFAAWLGALSDVIGPAAAGSEAMASEERRAFRAGQASSLGREPTKSNLAGGAR